MPSIDQEHLVILEGVLQAEFIPHLPPLSRPTRADEDLRKNLSRAFGAFAIHKLCGISPVDASKAVVDDYEDCGLDLVYYFPQTETLYAIQSKFKPDKEFSQDEALAFCQGVRKLIVQDFDGLNQNFQQRRVEIEDAIDDCSHIQLVVAHIGQRISDHAINAISEFLLDDSHGEERLIRDFIEYGSAQVLRDLRIAKAYPRIDEEIWIQKPIHIAEPRDTYMGFTRLEELAKLHQKHKAALYSNNIRTFLGHTTDVNQSIESTLLNNPKDFVYLNNGVTALCDEIEPKSNKAAIGKRFKVRGLSVINGAQTIATAARFLDENKEKSITGARVTITLIKANALGDFGKSVTKARNHQNPVADTDFIALEDGQESLRRDLSYLGIHYIYKHGGLESGANDSSEIRVEDAAKALALFGEDPRFAVWLKREPSRFLITGSDQYKSVFDPTPTAFALANAVCYYRFVHSRFAEESSHAVGKERLVYRHGAHVGAWLLAKRIQQSVKQSTLMNPKKIEQELSGAFDQLRASMWNHVQPLLTLKGPLAFFKNQTDAVPLMQDVMIDLFGLAADPVLPHKISAQKKEDPYPVQLFGYLISKAPQIGNLG